MTKQKVDPPLEPSGSMAEELAAAGETNGGLDDHFFRVGDGGGTDSSAALKLALEIARQHFPPEPKWNRYIFLAVADGEPVFVVALGEEPDPGFACDSPPEGAVTEGCPCGGCLDLSQLLAALIAPAPEV